MIVRPAGQRRASSRLFRAGTAALLAVAVVLSTVACGKNVQTLNPYTPTRGVNTDVGSVRLRDVLVISKAKGSGFLSASLVSTEQDTLLEVTGNPVKPDGSQGAAFTATLSAPVPIGGAMIILANRTPVTISSPDLQTGLTAKLVFRFKTAGSVSTFAPVVSATLPEYATISPSPAASPSS